MRMNNSLNGNMTNSKSAGGAMYNQQQVSEMSMGENFTGHADFQQRHMMSGNRSRNLVNIVTSVNESNVGGDVIGEYQSGQMRGMKRSCKYFI